MAVLYQYNAEVQLSELEEGRALVSVTCWVRVRCIAMLRGLVRTISCWILQESSSRLPRRPARSWLALFAVTSCRTCCSLTSHIFPNIGTAFTVAYVGDGALIGVFAGWGGEHKKPSLLVSDQGGGFLCSGFDVRVRVLGREKRRGEIFLSHTCFVLKKIC